MNLSLHYAFPERALRRWRDERLQLRAAPEGGWWARFHFDGSTCGNIPLSLRFDIAIAADRRIASVRCEPVPGDDGHERMCRFLEDAASLLEELAERGPLVGRPLDDVLGWRPATSPAGCVCTAPSRAHKWLAALQTVHFALATFPDGSAESRSPHSPPC